MIPVYIKGLMPTPSDCAVVLGNEEKSFFIYVDSYIGGVLKSTLDGERRERPMTHDLMDHILIGFSINLLHVAIYRMEKKTFYARLFLEMENELGKKIVEIDARPSDAMILAIRNKRKIYVTEEVFQEVEDVTDFLQKLTQQK